MQDDALLDLIRFAHVAPLSRGEGCAANLIRHALPIFCAVGSVILCLDVALMSRDEGCAAELILYGMPICSVLDLIFLADLLRYWI